MTGCRRSNRSAVRSTSAFTSLTTLGQCCVTSSSVLADGPSSVEFSAYLKLGDAVCEEGHLIQEGVLPFVPVILVAGAERVEKV
ncbi:hypothetical protein FH972_022034 [Carpinus fangiana]|uniref:Uncharacterized protein n=1 Tax=Carpinus fangiana TaxID=176857 RepID=A0A5N6KRE9_9ROSI|nr:hypothetical protein FH972_022034 [Carpinus fangiana]